MKEFIHTFGIETYLTDNQYNSFYRAYGYHNDVYFPDPANNKHVFSKYAQRGFRMELKKADPMVTKFDVLHRRFKADWIVTPGKLLSPGHAMMNLYTVEEYDEACYELYRILDEIENATDVDLLKEGRLYRVDVSKDIVTPSEEYSQEVIRMSKKGLYQYGYRFMEPVTDDKRVDYLKDENGVFFHNKRQDVKSKIYNKLEDLKIHHYNTAGMTGLLRFELALKRRALMNKKYITAEHLGEDDLGRILEKIMKDAYDLLHDHITTPLWNGAMLSKNLQRLYIWRYCDYKSDSAKYKKLMEYRKACNSLECMKDAEDMGSAAKHFKEMGLSPLYCSDEVGYIPAFVDLLDGTEDDRVREFLRIQKPALLRGTRDFQ